MEKANLSEKGKVYFKTIGESASRMRTLITDLMTYSITDVKERRFVGTDIGKLVEEVKTELAPLLLEHSGELEVQPLCSLAVNVSQFRQVFINLISNAIKFSRPGVPPRIRVQSKKLHWQDLEDEVPPVILSVLSHKEDYFRIQVIDNGIGFDPQYKDKIFEVFQRLHSKEVFKGTGIGLAIVKKIVTHHGGFITADSLPGEGSTFSIYLPLTTG
ncbi:MAG: arcB [Flaviaesturariibacter sp.]|nr:arcB [Flaviaesturariibacter sp.]